MAELATIARPYADALFKATASDLKAAAAWLEALKKIVGDPQLLQFAENPNFTADQVFELLLSISGEAKVVLPEMAKNFLRTVIDNGRLSAVPEIAEQFTVLMNAQGGSSDAVVYSAFAIDSAALADLAVTLEKRFARKLNVSVQLQPDLIGGIRVVVGDEVLDSSVKARLEQMKVALTA
ncbi:MAG: F-type H+-transporting ATPase subunit delta [Rhodoferax sp.]|jgi:F-type H+-transporting ATPase subunit delta